MYAQAQQSSAPTQQPHQSPELQPGPAPDLTSFVADSALSYQAAYGNDAVAGMALGSTAQGLEAESSEGGGSLDREEPELAASIRFALTQGSAALARSGEWSSRVPTSLQPDADRVVHGLADVDGYLLGLESTLRSLFQADERDEVALTAAIFAAEDLVVRVAIATEIVEAYETLYLGSIAEVAATALGLVGCAHIASAHQQRRDKALSAHERAEAAHAAMLAAAGDLVEVGVQTAAQSALQLCEDALTTAIFAQTGPFGLPVVGVLGRAFGWVDGKLDESLGVEPADLTAGLDGLVGDVNGHLGTIVTAAETVSSLESNAARIGAQLSQLDTALMALQVIEEGGAALAAFVASAKTYREARAELQEVCAEAEALFQQQLPQVVGALQSLPALVAAAQQDAARASNTIAALEGHYGDGLYAPPVL